MALAPVRRRSMREHAEFWNAGYFRKVFFERKI